MVTPEQLQILQHSLGRDEYGRPDPINPDYRNHFVTGPGSTDFEDCEKLVSAGLMVSRPYPGCCGGHGVLFMVTETGKRAIEEHSPRPPKLTRGQRRYREWLNADVDMPFGEWLKRGLGVNA